MAMQGHKWERMESLCIVYDTSYCDSFQTNKIFIMSELEINKNKLHICLKVKTAHADKMVYNTVGIC